MLFSFFDQSKKSIIRSVKEEGGEERKWLGVTLPRKEKPSKLQRNVTKGIQEKLGWLLAQQATQNKKKSKQ